LEKLEEYYRSLIEDTYDVPLSKNEDNSIREVKVNELLKKFVRLKEYKDAIKEWKAGGVDLNGPCEEMFTIANELFGLCNLEMVIIATNRADSAYQIEGLRDKEKLRLLLVVLTQEIAKFPYTFFRKINLRVITFCYHVNILAQSHLIAFEKKRFSGLFVFTLDRTPEKIIILFHQIIIHNCLRYDSNISIPWTKYNPDGFEYDSKANRRRDWTQNFLSEESMRSLFIDYSTFFSLLIQYPSKLLNHEIEAIRNKSIIMKEYLERVDKDGISSGFWDKLDKRAAEFENKFPSQPTHSDEKDFNNG
jgi:hypothetical protein